MLGVQLLTMHEDENLAKDRTLHLIRILERGCKYIYLGQKNMFALHILAKILPKKSDPWFILNALVKGDPVQMLWTGFLCPLKIHMLKL